MNEVSYSTTTSRLDFGYSDTRPMAPLTQVQLYGDGVNALKEKRVLVEEA